MELYFKALSTILTQSGFAGLTLGNIIMLIVAFVLLYLAIAKGFEPLLLVPIATGCLLVNLPLSGIMDEGGFLRYVFFGTEHEIYPVIIFMGIGALTDFSPLLANPITFLLGAAAQLGVFIALFGALMLGFTVQEAASIAIIGGADGPTSIYLTMKLAPQILGAVAVAAYSYMSLVPLIQPPVIKLLTTKKDRAIRMDSLRPVSKRERVLFPIICTIAAGLILPASVPLIGVLMFGNLLRECGVTERLSHAAQNEILNATTIFLGLTVGATMQADSFLTIGTIKIIFLGLVAFIFSTAGGVLFGQLMKILSGGKINPMIGAAGVSAVPMAARVVQRVSAQENPSNFLLMHAMGPNVAGVIGTAVAAGAMLTLLSN
ncbi:sodium ion-translocating decarboxylase, beta subunit [Thermovirga lienii DSM 17291]|jgi:oxaloacetate decarboxylase beta subunit|uniref:Sodium ion-translocating decarboxylase, beta subunit n=1 Tax=Thermovirga lienii (strain ATCC BAA-1197 / DSM 17291 / Cas60314) TaxID=580340 RepID=G7V7I0_THELD|nr:sodium ion-translocating decarboxylase subunit beta [Thermovirga lienii]MDN5319241.1 carboxybiotin decarboxylase [Thermovirga sp.]AER66142.1 sodium ion-translocating decarboxylase, beta subunit [Thermovirga lienii DSM 17291]KUK42980.1 MAG: Sodium ion-translocating decarboxylase, beta subunit [Thermovirga lienii]MDN5368359.1 carboxybiotin decarboxylase [Thermovirga sp.]HCD71163.1 sodium ion-translocating decarboxylase subunit beta [Thermovirga lienii]